MDEVDKTYVDIKICHNWPNGTYCMMTTQYLLLVHSTCFTDEYVLLSRRQNKDVITKKINAGNLY